MYHSEELVVFEMIRTLTKLLEFKLLSKPVCLENLDKLLPFLLHPNTWIRSETIEFIKFMADPKNQILTKAEGYCLIRPKLKKYLAENEKVYEIYGDDLQESKLRPPLSKEVYEREIRVQGTINADYSLSEDDKYAK